jgi:hypothetical protein
MHYSNGTVYKGTFELGEKNGHGILTTSDNEVYEGEFNMNVKEGS